MLEPAASGLMLMAFDWELGEAILGGLWGVGEICIGRIVVLVKVKVMLLLISRQKGLFEYLSKDDV